MAVPDIELPAPVSINGFSWEGLRLPLVLPAPKNAPSLDASKVLPHLIRKAGLYGSNNVVLFCQRPTLFAYFDGRSEPLTFETRWQDLCFLAERHAISILSDRLAVYSVPVAAIQSHLPSIAPGAEFIERNPRLENLAILLHFGNGSPSPECCPKTE